MDKLTEKRQEIARNAWEKVCLSTSVGESIALKFAECLLNDLAESEQKPVSNPTDEMVIRGAEVLHDSIRAAGFYVDFDGDLNGSEIQQRIAESVYVAMQEASAPKLDRKAQLDALLARLEVISEVHVISATYDRIRAERIFAADDLEYDLFAAGMKTAIEMMKGGA